MGRVVVVVGASGDIGKAITDKLQQARYSVIGTFCQRGGRVLTNGTHLDVRNPVEVQVVVKEVMAQYSAIDVWVNAFGIHYNKPWNDITFVEWDDMLAVNLRGVFLCCQAALPAMQVGGCIVNIASSGGQTGGTNAVHYAASKAGVISLTRSFARIAAPDKRVNCVAPGLIESRMSEPEINSTAGQQKIKQSVLLKRAGLPEEVAEAVMFCVENKYLTGQVIGVNGGLHFG